MPINPKNIVWDDQTPKADSIEWDLPKDIQGASSYQQDIAEATETIKNLGRVYPAFETAANMATSLYGVPISGLVGLAALPFGVDVADRAIKATQKYLVYQPQTDGGKQLTAATTYPLQKLDELGEAAGEMASDPVTGAISHAMIAAAPAIIGARSSVAAPKISGNYIKAVETGINKGVRPSVTKKELWQQRQQYMKNSQVAVDEIIQNKNNLKLVDRDGITKTGELPKTLEEFSQALDQTKKAIFEEYDSLAKSADRQGAQVSTVPMISELQNIVNNKVLQTVSPETIQYANKRIEALSGKSFTAQETQQIVKILNQSEKAFYSDPTPANMGVAYIDSLVANNFRHALDATIESATGWEYAPLKRKYGALRMLETDVTKRAIVDARKNIRGLIDFTDIFSGSQVVQGLIGGSPSYVASGLAARSIASMIKYLNDPNRIVSKMFTKAEKYSLIKPEKQFTIKGMAQSPTYVLGSMSGETENE